MPQETSLQSFYINMFGNDVHHAYPESLATITKVERYRDRNSWVNHEFVVVYASLGGTDFWVRIDRTRKIGGTEHAKLSWEAADTVSRAHASR